MKYLDSDTIVENKLDNDLSKALADTGEAINGSNKEEELDCNVKEDNEWAASNNFHDDSQYDESHEIIEKVSDPNSETLKTNFNITRGNVSKDEIDYYHNWISSM